jgi:hypothetical protein
MRPIQDYLQGGFDDIPAGFLTLLKDKQLPITEESYRQLLAEWRPSYVDMDRVVAEYMNELNADPI